MAAVESFLNEDAGAKKRRRQMIVSILIGVVLLHVAAGVIAGIFVVARYIFPPPANFVVKKDVRLPAKKREHKMNMAAADAIAPKPTLSDKMQSARPTAFSLPDVPDLPLDQMLPLDPSQLLSDQMSSLSNSEALGTASGASAAGSGGFGGKGVSFLGVNSTGKRVLLLFDISQTVAKNAAAAGFPYSKINEEAQNLFKGLPVTARFGVAKFNEGNIFSFKDSLVPNGSTNRNEAIPWLSAELDQRKRANCNSLTGVMISAQKMKPDLIFILTDAQYIVPWSEVKQEMDAIRNEDGTAPQINFIVFGPRDEDLKGLRTIAKGDNIKVIVKK